ncbi:PepSY domain-containing protein [Methylocystis sp. ATCC 49242]|uniref:PepSY-associated TM helix domain-containing protein n=1 Tax=Methylocystis sp. ATCC 49242 TaxID=622637 RepID=UPI0001F86AD8|nr:PepSY-associated TM helix domain-containing protein [Methylocystis sp. ATCC 49242]
MNRSFFVRLHRWAGLAMAGFLILAGTTGSLLAFQQELNHWLTPELYPEPRPGPLIEPAALAHRAETLAPQGRAKTVYIGYPGTALIGMGPRPGAAPLDFDTLFLDPTDGRELGRIKSGGPPTALFGVFPTTLSAIMPFIYDLHMTLALGNVGAWILGIFALIWTLDCFVALYLTLPAGAFGLSNFFTRWKCAWSIKFRSSFFRVNFDLHRAGGLWLWIPLLIFAWSSVSFKLPTLYRTTMQMLFEYQPPAWALPPPQHAVEGKLPLTWDDAQAIGRKLMAEEADRHKFTVERELALYILPDDGYAEYRVRSSRDIGMITGQTSIFFDAYTGALQNVILPTGHRPGNSITTWLIELHMANLFGLPYRVFVCGLGFLIVMLSGTGVYIWWKKRSARSQHVGRAWRRLRRPNGRAIDSDALAFSTDEATNGSRSGHANKSHP